MQSPRRHRFHADCHAFRGDPYAIDADIEEARQIGITGTPAFVMNGIVISGLPTSDSLNAVIREELGPAGSGS